MKAPWSRRWSIVAVFAAAAAAASCASVGSVFDDDDIDRDRTTQLYGEVRSVDTRSGRIQVREEHGGSRTVRYDNRTRVVYRQRNYPVTALERGDRVRMTVSYDRNRTAWADRVEVRESMRDRGSTSTGRVQRVEGRVTRVDTRRDWFAVESGRSTVVVHISRNTRREDVRRFERLRRGDRIRAEIRSLGRGEAELIRFR